MSSKKLNALSLAEQLEQTASMSIHEIAAEELRRLHGLNQWLEDRLAVIQKITQDMNWLYQEHTK